jgi:hypothetical protein
VTTSTYGTGISCSYPNGTICNATCAAGYVVAGSQDQRRALNAFWVTDPVYNAITVEKNLSLAANLSDGGNIGNHTFYQYSFPKYEFTCVPEG